VGRRVGAQCRGIRVGWRRCQCVGCGGAGERYHPAIMRPATCDRDTRGCGSVIIELDALDLLRACPIVRASTKNGPMLEASRMRGGRHGRAAASFYVARRCRNAGHLVAGGNILLGQRN
jgi:hypothetical protein